MIYRMRLIECIKWFIECDLSNVLNSLSNASDTANGLPYLFMEKAFHQILSLTIGLQETTQGSSLYFGPGHRLTSHAAIQATRQTMHRGFHDRTSVRGVTESPTYDSLLDIKKKKMKSITFIFEI